MEDKLKRVWISLRVTMEMKNRIKKAAARNEIPMTEYMRIAITTYMLRQGEWSIRGPQKGA